MAGYYDNPVVDWLMNRFDYDDLARRINNRIRRVPGDSTGMAFFLFNGQIRYDDSFDPPYKTPVKKNLIMGDVQYGDADEDFLDAPWLDADLIEELLWTSWQEGYWRGPWVATGLTWSMIEGFYLKNLRRKDRGAAKFGKWLTSRGLKQTSQSWSTLIEIVDHYES
jgi:hypothetical protein